MNKQLEKLIVRLKADKKLLFIIVLGISGMLLLLLSGNTDSKKDEKNEGESIGFEEISESVEKNLTELIKTVNGAGKVKVMVSIDCLEEKTIAVNTERETADNKTDIKDEYVIIEKSQGTDGLVLKITTPKIRGVGITCQGAQSVTVRQEIIKLVSATLGIPVNRIWVAEMKE